MAKTLIVLALITAQAHGMDFESKTMFYALRRGSLENNAVVVSGVLAAASSTSGSFSESGKKALAFAAAFAVTRKLLETDAARNVLGCASNVPVIGFISRNLAADESTSRTALETAAAYAILFGLQKACPARTHTPSSN